MSPIAPSSSSLRCSGSRDSGCSYSRGSRPCRARAPPRPCARRRRAPAPSAFRTRRACRPRARRSPSARARLGVVIETTSTLGIGDSARQSAVAFSKPNSLARLPRKSLLDLAEREAADDRRVAEHRLNAGPGEGVAFAHVARADQSDPDSVHGPLSLVAAGDAARQNKYFTSYPIWNICSIRSLRRLNRGTSSVRRAKGSDERRDHESRRRASRR